MSASGDEASKQVAKAAAPSSETEGTNASPRVVVSIDATAGSRAIDGRSIADREKLILSQTMQIERQSEWKRAGGVPLSALQEPSNALRAAERMAGRRRLDPLEDEAFRQRVLGEHAFNPAMAASERANLQRRLEDAASKQIARVLHDPLQRMRMENEARTAAAHEADRLIRAYGLRIVDEKHFLSEYAAGLALFETQILASAMMMERSELLARSALPASYRLDFMHFDAISVQTVRTYIIEALEELTSDYQRDGNPLWAWQAFSMANAHGVEVPEWVFEYLSGCADAIMSLRDSPEDSPTGKEAERIGKALGFGRRGVGRRGWFVEASLLQRDREIYADVKELMAEEPGEGKHRATLSNAYFEVAKVRRLDDSTVQRSFVRISKLVGAYESPDA